MMELSKSDRRYRKQIENEQQKVRRAYNELKIEKLRQLNEAISHDDANKEIKNFLIKSMTGNLLAKSRTRKFRRAIDPSFKCMVNLRSRISETLYNLTDNWNSKSFQKLDYSPAQLKKHLESQWQRGMCWDNYGEWHIDHIYPISKFPRSTPIEIIFSLENLRPMWAFENRSKANSITEIPKGILEYLSKRRM